MGGPSFLTSVICWPLAVRFQCRWGLHTSSSWPRLRPLPCLSRLHFRGPSSWPEAPPGERERRLPSHRGAAAASPGWGARPQAPAEKLLGGVLLFELDYRLSRFCVGLFGWEEALTWKHFLFLPRERFMSPRGQVTGNVTSHSHALSTQTHMTCTWAVVTSPGWPSTCVDFLLFGSAA